LMLAGHSALPCHAALTSNRLNASANKHQRVNDNFKDHYG
jgi:hypothetical protein